MFDFFNGEDFLDFIQSIALLSVSVGLLIAQRAHFILNKKLDNLHARLILLKMGFDLLQQLNENAQHNKDKHS